MDHLQDVFIIKDHPDMDKPLQAEPESVIDDHLLFPLTLEDTDSPIQVEPELPPIEVISSYLLCGNTLYILWHPPDCYRDTGHV